MFILLKQVRMGTINTSRMSQHIFVMRSPKPTCLLYMKRSFFFPPRVPFQLCAEMTAWELINSWLLILLPHFQAFKLPQQGQLSWRQPFFSGARALPEAADLLRMLRSTWLEEPAVPVTTLLPVPINTSVCWFTLVLFLLSRQSFSV